MSDTLVVNFFGGPGAGKSTIAAQAFGILKTRARNVELVPEFAKDLTWDGHIDLLQRDPVWGFGEQHRRISRVVGKVEAVLVDSPLLLIGYYEGGYSAELNQLILAEHFRWPSLNYFVSRKHAYDARGRNESEAQALEVDRQVMNMLTSLQIPYEVIIPVLSAGQAVANGVEKALWERRKPRVGDEVRPREQAEAR